MTRLRWLSLICLLASSPCEAGEKTQTNGPAKLEVRYDSAQRRLELADLITVVLTVEGSPALNVYGAPLELPTSAKWVLVERSADQREVIGPKRVRWQITYRFGPREPGKDIAFAFPEVKFRDGSDESVTWMPIPFEVVSQIDVPDPSKLKGSAATIEQPPAVELPEESGWKWWLLSLLIPLAGVLILGVRLLFYRPALRSPAQLALYEWQRLIALKLPEKGRSERFITLLTLLVRHYLERQFAMPARRQTTKEFLVTLEASSAISKRDKQFLVGFLQRCEAVKFAQGEMSVEECEQWATGVRKLLHDPPLSYRQFNDRARKVMQLANQEAQRFNHKYIGTEHILIGLVKEGTGVAARALKNLDIDLSKIRLEVEKVVQAGPDMVTMGKLPQTPRAKKVLEYSIEEGRILNHDYIGPEHLLLGLLDDQEGFAAQILINLGLKLEDVRMEVLMLLTRADKV